MSYFHVFPKNVASHFVPREKISCFQEKNPSFQVIQERSCVGVDLFGKTIFSESLKKILYFCILFIFYFLCFWERSSFIFRLRCKIMFSGKRNIIFPDNTRKVIFQRNFLERPSFQDVWKKKIWFSVQWLFRRCSIFPCSGVPKFIVCLFKSTEKIRNIRKEIWRTQRTEILTLLQWWKFYCNFCVKTLQWRFNKKINLSWNSSNSCRSKIPTLPIMHLNITQEKTLGSVNLLNILLPFGQKLSPKRIR